MLMFDIGARLNLDKTKASVSPTMQDVHPYKHILVLKHSLENRWDIGIRSEVAGCANCLTKSAFAANFHSSGEQLACEHPDFASLLDNRLCLCIRLCRKFRVVNLPVETFEALGSSDELGFADSHAHRNAFLCIG